MGNFQFPEGGFAIAKSIQGELKTMSCRTLINLLLNCDPDLPVLMVVQHPDGQQYCPLAGAASVRSRFIPHDHIVLTDARETQRHLYS